MPRRAPLYGGELEYSSVSPWSSCSEGPIPDRVVESENIDGNAPNHAGVSDSLSRDETEFKTVPCTHCGLPCRNVSAESIASREPVFCCAGCRLVYSILNKEDAQEGVNRTLLRLGLGIFLTMNVMAFSFPFYGKELLHPATEGASTSSSSTGMGSGETLFRWFIFLIASVVILLLGAPIARDAFENLKRGRIQSTLLITIGVGAAYALSIASVIRNNGAIYFDSACMVVTLVTIGYYIEGRMKLRAVNAVTGKLADLPLMVMVERKNGTVEAPADDVQPGETICVTQGGAIAVDGEVKSGTGAVIESSLTGEAAARAVREGETVYAGSVLSEGFLRIKAVHTGSSRRVEQIVQMLTDSRLRPPEIQRLTDRVSAVFVPLAVILAITAFSWQAWSGEWAEGIMRALAVALIACPCALGLAAPLATWNAVRQLARDQVVVRSGGALELGASLRDIFIDKTGTLTDGSFRLERLLRIGPLQGEPISLTEARGDARCLEMLTIVSALEQHAAHPVALALRAIADPIDLDAEPVTTPGLGVAGCIKGIRWSVGRPEMESVSNSNSPSRSRNDAVENTLRQTIDSMSDLHPIVVRREGVPVLLIGLSENVREDAGVILDRLRNEVHVNVRILTGDSSEPASAIGARFDVPIETGLLPDQKRERIRSLRTETNRPIGYVGDGVNDAPSLAEADLGIAVSKGADLAKLSGDVVLLADDLTRVVELIHTARKTRRRIVGSLVWMFSYNVVGFTLAITGMMTPAYAAVAMVGSSAFIIWNSARGWNRAGIEP